MAQVTTTAPHPKHNIHKFWDIKPKLGRDNWVSWKCELLAMARDRGLYTTILGTDILPTHSDPNFTTINDIPHIGKIPLLQLVDEWHDRNNTAYNQVLLCISLELQTAINDTDEAAIAWKILTRKFELTNPTKISIVRTHYKNYHMVEGQSVVSYLTSMKEFRSQLKKMGENTADSTHAAMLPRNLPESWRPISQTIRMIAHTPDDIEERLEAHELISMLLKCVTRPPWLSPHVQNHCIPTLWHNQNTLTTTPNLTPQDPDSIVITVANLDIQLRNAMHQGEVSLDKHHGQTTKAPLPRSHRCIAH